MVSIRIIFFIITILCVNRDENNMREEDKKAIHRALAILKVECQEHKSCKSCRFYDCTYNDCLLNKPPMHYKVDEIIKCFT